MDNDQVKPRSPVALSKKSMATADGTALLTLLERIMADGRLASQEITELSAWLETTASTATLPGIHFLREEVTGVLADGAVSEAESRLLIKSILRVLPVTERERAKAKVAEATARERAAAATAANLVTQKQLAYIRDLGGTCPENATKWQASEIIDQLVTSRPTARQQMVLRFWNRLDLSTEGVEGVSEWMDQWYDEDPRRLEAWELWKQESRDDGSRSFTGIDRVPLGAGPKYLARVNATQGGWSKGKLITACFILLVIALAILWLRQ